MPLHPASCFVEDFSEPVSKLPIANRDQYVTCISLTSMNERLVIVSDVCCEYSTGTGICKSALERLQKRGLCQEMSSGAVVSECHQHTSAAGSEPAHCRDLSIR